MLSREAEECAKVERVESTTGSMEDGQSPNSGKSLCEVETGAADTKEEKRPSRCARFKAWLLKWHLPLLLIFALIIGFLLPGPGTTLNDADLGGICFNDDICVWSSVGSLCVTLIFLISGLKLKTDAIKKAITAWKATLYGVVMILFVSPCLSFALIKGNFGVDEFAIGLALFIAMPTTLSSGPVLVGQAKGNVALALMLTVVTNVLGVFTAPLFVSKFIDIYVQDNAENIDGNVVDISLDPVPLIVQLTFTILIPLFVGKALADFVKPVSQFAKKRGTELKLLSSVLLALIPWMKVSSSADSFREVDGVSFVLMWLTGIAMHILLLVINFVITRYVMHLDLDVECALVIVASQKTLPVAMTILEFLPDSVGAPGLIAIPIIVSHLMQILIDSVVASKYAAKASQLEAS